MKKCCKNFNGTLDITNSCVFCKTYMGENLDMEELNDEGVQSNNHKILQDFALYCLEHPEERFWQALRNWAKVGYIYSGDNPNKLKDTFYN